MKKLKILFRNLIALALTINAISAFSQWSGQCHYGHPIPLIVSSGTYVQANPGFVIAGYQQVTTLMQPSIYIDKTDPDGGLAGGFSTGYLLAHACSGSMTQMLNCYGASVIENSSGGYAMTASFDDGCVFATLDGSGNVLLSVYFQFLQGASQITQPVICESIVNPGDFYMSGSFEDSNGADFIYTLKINNSGSVLFNTFNSIGSLDVVPRGIVESNYGGVTKLAICGYTEVYGNGTKLGFVALMNASNGIMTGGQLALDLGAGTDEEFNSIALSSANQGYILGGYTTLGGKRPLWVRLDQNLTINALSIQNTTFSSSEIVSVAERFSSFYNAYEYYGAAKSSSGMLVLKVGGNLTALSPATLNNEFLFNLGVGTSLARCLSINDVPGSANRGIHVFGTSASLPAGDFFLNMSLFNGATGVCGVPIDQDHAQSVSWNSPTATLNWFPLLPGGSLSQCSSHLLVKSNTTTWPAQLCPWWGTPSLPYAGSNNREVPTTSGEQLSKNNISVFPNPVKDFLVIEAEYDRNFDISVDIVTPIGSILHLNRESIDVLRKEVVIDLKQYNLAEGVYVLVFKIGEKRINHKFVVE